MCTLKLTLWVSVCVCACVCVGCVSLRTRRNWKIKENVRKSLTHLLEDPLFNFFLSYFDVFFFTLFFTLERSVRTICCPFDPPFPWGNQPQVAKGKGGGGASRRGERENSSLGFRICIRNLYACSGHEMKNVASFWRLSTWWTWSTWTLCHLSLADENNHPPPPHQRGCLIKFPY